MKNVEKYLTKKNVALAIVACLIVMGFVGNLI